MEEKLHGKGQLCTNLTYSPSDDTEVYLLRVKWLSPDQPFAEDGDSGSLVYAKANGHIIPLGIHGGSKGDVSIAFLLHSWWLEFEISLMLIFIVATRRNVHTCTEVFRVEGRCWESGVRERAGLFPCYTTHGIFLSTGIVYVHPLCCVLSSCYRRIPWVVWVALRPKYA